MKIKDSRKKAKQLLGKYGSLEVTWKKFDCDGEDCEECKVCKYLNFLDWAESVSFAGSTIEYNRFIEKYLDIKAGEKKS